MSHPPSFPTSTSTSNSPLTPFTTLAITVVTTLASNPTTITNPDLFGNDPYFPADLTVVLTSSSPTSTSAANTTGTTLFPTAFPAPPTPALRWFEQAWMPVVVWLLFAYSLASAVVLIWMWCVDSWSPNSTGDDAGYEYRIRHSVVDARAVDEMIIEDEMLIRLSTLTQQQQLEQLERIRERNRYVEMSDAVRRMGTF